MKVYSTKFNKELDTDIKYLKGVGAKRAEQLEKLGIESVYQLIHHYPSRYFDYSSTVSVAEANVGEIANVSCIVLSKSKPAFIRKGMTIYKLRVGDETGDIEITMFNNPWGFDALKISKEYIFSGRIEGSMIGKKMSAPSFIGVDDPVKLRPVYPLTKGITSPMLMKLIKQGLSTVENLPDPLPQWIKDEYNLIDKFLSLQQIHFPLDQENLENARRRLIFEELLVMRLGVAYMRYKTNELMSPRLSVEGVGEFIEKLPFKLTAAQKKCVDEILHDLKKNRPMNRLLQGDVGSGKTVVAAAGAYSCVSSGHQAAFVAPTEILATQHYNTLKPIFESLGYRVTLLTGSVKGRKREQIVYDIEQGHVALVIGTHALFEEDVRFKNLAYTVTDEQHRFGVAQRSKLAKKGAAPHILVMSATPIPRTMALMLYGEMSVSVIDSMPPGRIPVKTRLVPENKREGMYSFIRDEISGGRQCYIVCPAIEDDEERDMDLATVQSYKKIIESSVLRDVAVEYLHGRLRPAEKEAIMERFRTGETKLLVSTTVIEVGVDVRNATVMVVENAERFGLSQLHQLRGRVGRGNVQSWCFLLSGNSGAQERLEFMTTTASGFDVAEFDLKNRGPGNFFGTQQHGVPQLKIAVLSEDTKIFGEAVACANKILASDPEIYQEENEGLSALVLRLFYDGYSEVL